MAKIFFDGHVCEAGEHETVLDALHRHGVAVPSSCRSGICQSCLLRADRGTPPPAAQHGLRPALRERNFFLACSCIAAEDMAVALPSNDDLALVEAIVIDRMPLNDNLLRLRLRLAVTTPFSYHAGQFVNLRRGDLIRSYSLASVPDEDDFLELHVQRVEGGRMSSWLHEACARGTALTLQGPLGECHYRAEHRDQPLLLIGTGSGLAPLWGIVRDALRQGHAGPIHLFHGGRRPADLYLTDELRALAATAGNFHYTPCVSRAAGDEFLTAGRANEVALGRRAELRGWQVFLCGNAAMVKATKKRAFLAGARLADIHADPFEFAPPQTG